MGGGVGLTWHSPIRIATDNAMYAMPESGIGLFCDVGGSYFLPRIRPDSISAGLFLGIVGHRLKARDLVKWGIATHFVSADKMEALRADINKVDHSHSNSDILSIVDSHSDASAKHDAIDNYDEIKEIFHPDSIWKIFERLEKSESEFG